MLWMTFSFLAQPDKTQLQAVPKRLSSAGITLNSRKCEFCNTSHTFLGHVIDQRGITADPNKTAAIQQMETPKSVSELCRLLGMVNQLGKFSPNIAELSKSLRELLSAKKPWLWTPTQDKGFINLKKDLTTHNILTMYDPSALVLTQPSLLMPLPMSWEQFCYRKSKASGILLHTLHAQ